jgi:hypothetical protein
MAAAPANPNFTAPMAPPAPPMPSGTAPTPGDESAMAAGLAAGPQAGPREHKNMTKPPHNIHGPSQDNGAYGPSAPNPNGVMPV